ncbi:helix-turn-helix domain-containing protein [Peptoanaerobacter stomatis]|uniref:helix-turn-helix domain-containing protein n=1 Tax=Peptoanaerobacter stomatis TaxID=796937 RepID=UPI003FA0E0F9
MTLGDIIKEYRHQHNLSMDKFAEISGITKGYISMLEKNRHPRTGNSIKPSLEIIKQVSTAINADLDFVLKLLDEETEIQLDSGTQFAEYEHKINNLIEKQDNIWKIKPVRKIPIISEIACGEPIVLNDNEQESIEVEEYVKGDFAFKARGDSMINAGIENGNIVFIKKGRYINNGDIVAVAIEDEITLKTYRKKDNKIYFLPENSDYDPIIFKTEELEYTNVSIIGVATHILKAII